MKLDMFTIRDIKATEYARPFFVPNELIARRSVADLASTKDNDVGKYPTDFELYYLGEFDGLSGEIVSLEKPRFVCNVVELVGDDDEDA